MTTLLHSLSSTASVDHDSYRGISAMPFLLNSNEEHNDQIISSGGGGGDGRELDRMAQTRKTMSAKWIILTLISIVVVLNEFW